MDRRQRSIAVISVAVAVLAATCVSASISETNTPLYTLRMEQLSRQMNFLPVEKNGFRSENHLMIKRHTHHGPQKRNCCKPFKEKDHS